MVNSMIAKGYSKMNMHHFVQCWTNRDAQRNDTYCVRVTKTLYWYENFSPVLEQYCIDNHLQ